MAETLRISIHAPPRGATGAFRPKCRTPSNFNSRPSARGDGSHRGAVEALPISIHAPPRGATPTSPWARRRWTFQFTPLREGRPLRARMPRSSFYFNSRPSARGDAIQQRAGRAGVYFNSRPSARGDWKPSGGGRNTRFQFTPLREGRRQKICNFCKSFVQPLQISMA